MIIVLIVLVLYGVGTTYYMMKIKAAAGGMAGQQNQNAAFSNPAYETHSASGMGQASNPAFANNTPAYTEPQPTFQSNEGSYQDVEPTYDNNTGGYMDVEGGNMDDSDDDV